MQYKFSSTKCALIIVLALTLGHLGQQPSVFLLLYRVHGIDDDYRAVKQEKTYLDLIIFYWV